MRYALIVLLLSLLACHSGESRVLTSEPCQTTLCCTACRPVTVGKTIDGDTIDSSEGRIRLFGIDAPEIGEPCYGEAKTELRKLSGNRIRVEEGPRSTDNFQRLLYYAYTESGEVAKTETQTEIITKMAPPTQEERSHSLWKRILLDFFYGA